MPAKQIKTETYVVKVGKGFINEDNTLIATTDISELNGACALLCKEGAEIKAREFGGKIYEVVMVEREMN